jgi:hypothetical protein
MKQVAKKIYNKIPKGDVVGADPLTIITIIVNILKTIKDVCNLNLGKVQSPNVFQKFWLRYYIRKAKTPDHLVDSIYNAMLLAGKEATQADLNSLLTENPE